MRWPPLSLHGQESELASDRTPFLQIALLYEAVTGQTPDYSKSPAAQAAAQPPASSPQTAAAPTQGVAASPKPSLTIAGSSPSPSDDISVFDLTGLPADGSVPTSQAGGSSSNPVPNPAVAKPSVGEPSDGLRLGYGPLGCK